MKSELDIRGMQHVWEQVDGSRARGLRQMRDVSRVKGPAPSDSSADAVKRDGPMIDQPPAQLILYDRNGSVKENPNAAPSPSGDPAVGGAVDQEVLNTVMGLITKSNLNTGQKERLENLAQEYLRAAKSKMAQRDVATRISSIIHGLKNSPETL